MAPRAPEHRTLAAALYALSWATLAFAGRSLGVAAGEGEALGAAVEAARAVASRFGAATAWLGPPIDGPPHFAPATLPAALGLLLGRVLPPGLVDGLTALRLGLAAVTALAPPLVFLLARRTLGPGAAALAGLLALFHPRWLVAASTLHGEGALAAGVVATLWAYGRFHERPKAPEAAALGAAYALALVASPVALTLPAAVVMHAAWPSSPRAPHEGDRWRRLALALASMGAGAGVGLGLNEVAARALGLSPLLWAAERSAARPGAAVSLGAGQAFAMPWVSAPASTAVLALVGVASFLWLAWRHPGRARPLVAPAAAGAFLAARPFTWPAPHALGRDGALVPLVGLFAALGGLALYGVFARRALGGRPAGRAPAVRGAALALALAGPWWASLRAPATLSASFSALVGGPGRVARTGALPLHDASPVGALAAAIDGLGRPEIAAHAPGVPAEVWAWSHRLGRLRTRVRPAPDATAADVEVRTGGEPPAGAAVVRRDGQAIVSARAAAPDAAPVGGGAPSP